MIKEKFNLKNRNHIEALKTGKKKPTSDPTF